MSHTEVILEDLKNNPQCPHGPTVLFSRVSGGERKNYYSCSACRDRKDCPFYLNESTKDKSGDKSQIRWKKEIKKYKNVDHKKLFLTLNSVMELSPALRSYCHTCDEFILLKYKNKHKDHKYVENISDYQLTHPSEFLHPLDNPKIEAQFLFSKTTIKTLVEIMKQQRFRNVVCIGAPRLHEYISTLCDMTSLLLDIDKRFHSFFGPLQYCWYNMFNNHFFSENARELFHDFLKTNGNKDLVIVMDPPFGGRVELIAQTIASINALNKSFHNLIPDLPVLFIFPYFMEPQILNRLSNFAMLDYKVDYDNHPLFHDGKKGRKQGSPVRIFTNIDICSVLLPTEEGYEYCDKCNRWVSTENRHCDICNACTSKDGRTYVHCEECERCVKPTWAHCHKCNRCAQTNHQCKEITFDQTCFHCNEPGHKKRECPKVDHEELQLKRKMGIKTKFNKKLKKK